MRSLAKKAAVMTVSTPLLLGLALLMGGRTAWAGDDAGEAPPVPMAPTSDALAPGPEPATALAPTMAPTPPALPARLPAPMTQATAEGSASESLMPELEAALSESVVSTASRTAESQTNAPATMTIITAEDLRAHGLTTLQEALQYLAVGIFVHERLSTSSEVGANGVCFNGDYLNHLLVLLDGHVLNEQWAGSMSVDRGSGIPIWIIDHIEVMLGPSSVLYGTNAMLGVVNVVTKRVKDAPSLHVGLNLWAAPAVDSDGKAMSGLGGLGKEGSLTLGMSRTFQLAGRTGEALLSVEYNRLEGQNYHLGVQHYGDDGIQGPKNFGPYSPPGYWGGTTTGRSYWSSAPSAFGRVSWGDFELRLRGTYYKRANPVQFGDFDSGNTWEREQSLSADLRHHRNLGPIDLLSRFYTDIYSYKQFIDDSGAGDCVISVATDGCYYTLTGAAKTVGLEEQVSYDLLGDGRFMTLFGADGRLRKVGSTTIHEDRITHERPDVSSNNYDKKEGSLGVYLQETLRPLNWLALNLGSRLDWDKRFGLALSPRAAAIANAWRGGTLKLIYAEAFRAPTAFESYWSDPSYAVVPTLRPEKVRNIEASAAQKLGASRVFVSGFWSSWHDMVSFHELSPTELEAAIAAGKLVPGTPSAVTTANLAGLKSYGLHFGIDGSVVQSRIRYALSGTLSQTRYQDPEATVTDPASGNLLPLGSHRLVLAPQLLWKASVAVDQADHRHSIALSAFYLGSVPTNQAFTDAGFVNAAGAHVEPYSTPEMKLRLAVSGATQPRR
jgi:outer membrane receptor for ferrienterochelin and colicins